MARHTHARHASAAQHAAAASLAFFALPAPALGGDWSASTRAQLADLVAGLGEDTLYYWRVRLVYHPGTTPFQQTSRWITSLWNGWNEARLRTAELPTTVSLVALEAAAGTSTGQSGGIVTALIGLAPGAAAALLFAYRPSQSRWRVPPEGDFS